MPLYGTIFYGGGDDGGFYGPSSTDVPQDLKFYRTDTDGIYVFHWGFKEAFITPALAGTEFDLQLDTTQDFLPSSPDLVTHTNSSVIEVQDGDVRKGFVVNVADRVEGQEQTWYARVRSKVGFNTSSWSEPLQFIIPEKFEQEASENIVDSLPDFHVYNKEDLKKPLAERNTNLYTVANMYGQEFDTVLYEDLLTKTDNYINLCRDESLFENFGVFFDYKRPQTQEFVEYRECLSNLIRGSLVGGTIDAVERVIRCFTGVSPTLISIKERNDFFITPVFEIPPEAPDGIRTFFSTTTDYKVGSLQVIQNGTVLDPGVDFTENHSAIGFDMTVAPSGGDLLQVVYDIGDEDDPEPVIFDISETTTLTGTVTFTNDSFNVTAVGGAFLSELAPGTLITDATGLVLGRVRNIVDDDNLVLTDVWIGSTSATASAKKINFNGTKHLSGDITFTNGSATVTGVGSAFLAELIPGNEITDNSGTVFGVVDSITDNTTLTLTSAWTGSTGSNTNARVLVYEEPIVWNSSSLAHGLVIQVNNPGLFTLNTNLIETLVRKVLPAHVEAFFEFN